MTSPRNIAKRGIGPIRGPTQPPMKPCLSCEKMTRSHIYEKEHWYFYFCHRCKEALPNDQIQKLIQIVLEQKQRGRLELNTAAQTLIDFEKKKREEARKRDELSLSETSDIPEDVPSEEPSEEPDAE